VQILCLRLTLDDADLAARAGLAWSALRRASHHHAYELAPTVSELRGWLAVLEELVATVEGAEAGAPPPLRSAST
jgi:hypothetical protein